MKYKTGGVIATIVETLTAASESKPVTKQEILGVLKAKFPLRKPASMKTTVDQQVPTKLRVDGGLIVRKNQEGYWLPSKNGAHDSTIPQHQVPQTIRIDQDVWKALQERAIPLVESPNDVLRRLLGLMRAS